MLSPDLISRKCEICGAGRKTPPDGDQRAGPIRSRRFRIKRLGQILSPASRVASAASPADEEGERSGAGHRPSDRGSAGYAGRAIVFPDEAGSITVGGRGGYQSILTHSIADLTVGWERPTWSAVIEPHQQVCSPPSRWARPIPNCTRSTTAPANCRTAVLDRVSCRHGVTRLECSRRAMGCLRENRRESGSSESGRRQARPVCPKSASNGSHRSHSLRS
jgi:hypothetical protein